MVGAMSPGEMDELLASMLDDHRLSRGERRALRELIVDRGLDDQRLAVFRSRAFELARLRVDADPLAVIDWLEDAVKSLLPRTDVEPPDAEARFSPGDECLATIVGEFRRSRTRADVCVFTITDDRIVEAMLDAHGRGVDVRVVTDDDKALDLGSDAERLRRAGLQVRMDDSPNHMHHKFAVFDRQRLVTGSYNWTRSAAERNHENLVLSEHPRLVRAFDETFARLWQGFGPP
jgi:phosphatidylserine/phosphatidylglycerophosphate/cardiolipin synthase-like enzyme